MKIINVGDTIFPGEYRLHSQFERVINFTNGTDFLAVVLPEVGNGPINVVFNKFECYPGNLLAIDQTSLWWGGRRFHYAPQQIYQSALEVRDFDTQKFICNLLIFKEILIALSPPKSLAFLFDPTRLKNFQSGFEKALMERIASAIRELENGNLSTGVQQMKGCGFGLTPSGDDFIAGMLIALNLLQRLNKEDFSQQIERIYKSAKTDNIFSNIFLNLACKGLLFENMKKLIHAILHQEKQQIVNCTRKLCSVGSTSGADLAAGFGFMLLMNL